ncbi:hypothetical protein JCM16307_17460 [Thermococcus prieurii]
MMRNLFPALEKFKAYINTASTGLMPSTALLEATKLLSDVIEFNGEVNSVAYMDEVVLKPLQREAGRLMKVRPENVGLSIQTTEGLRRILLALEPKRGAEHSFPRHRVPHDSGTAQELRETIRPRAPRR